MLYGVRRWRLDTVGIIQFQIKAQTQRVIERSPQVAGYAVNTTIMFIDDSRFAVWVSANLCISAYHILWERHQELVAGNFRATVNNRLDEKSFVSRQRFLAGMLLQYNQITASISPGIV